MVIKWLKSRNLLNIGIVISIIALLYGSVIFSYAHLISVDDREHLNSSYMVFRGMVPYRDFFQHHHPLLWYMFAPVFYVIGESVIIYNIMSGFMLIVAAVTGYMIYLCGRILGEKKSTAWLGVLLWQCFPVVQIGTGDFRPDNPMIMAFMAGLYYFLRYLKEKNGLCLILSFMLFFISLLFLQKALFLLAPLGLVSLGLLYKKEIKWGDLLKAAVLPLLLLAFGLGMLYICGGLRRYWELNWLLNLKIEVISDVANEHLWIVAAGVGIAAIGFWRINNLLYRVVCVCYVLMALPLLFFRPWHWQYLLPYYPFLALILARLVDRLSEAKRGGLLIFVSLYMSIGYVEMMRREVDSPIRIGIFKHITQLLLNNSNRDDLVLQDIDGFVGDMRLSALGYYWYSLGHVARYDSESFGEYGQPEFDEIVKSVRPKIIANGYWRECELGMVYGPNKACYNWLGIDQKYLHENYRDLGFFYVRKD